MADKTTTLGKVLLGDTTVEVVGKINAGIEQINSNTQEISNNAQAIAGNATNLADFKEDLQDGSVVVNKATNADYATNAANANAANNALSAISANTAAYATYDASETSNTQKTAIADKYVTKNAYNQKILELEQNIADAGQIDDVQDSNGNSLVTDKIAKLPELYTKAETDKLLGDLAGGMQYVGTLGTGGTVTALPTSDVKSGYTYKVITAGTYANQAADVGDLFIATVKNNTITWTLVPSGDDGDVYADENFSNEGEIIVSDFGGGKKVKSTGYTISNGSNDNKTIPTISDVNTLIQTTVFRQDIIANGLFIETRGDNGEYYYKRAFVATKKYSFSVFDRNASPLVVGIHRETDGTVVITSDRSLIDLGAYIVVTVAKW